jgi:predicted acyltransferase
VTSVVALGWTRAGWIGIVPKDLAFWALSFHKGIALSHSTQLMTSVNSVTDL